MVSRREYKRYKKNLKAIERFEDKIEEMAFVIAELVYLIKNMDNIHYNERGDIEIEDDIVTVEFVDRFRCDRDITSISYPIDYHFDENIIQTLQSDFQKKKEEKEQEELNTKTLQEEKNKETRRKQFLKLKEEFGE